MGALDDLMVGNVQTHPKDLVAQMMLPSSSHAKQARDTVKGALDALLINPGWELGGALQNIMQGQGQFGDYADAGMNIAGAIPGIGGFKAALAAGKVSPAIFAGLMAKTADRTALKTAEQMAAKGAAPKDIWNQTGWFKGTEGKWKFEIPDEKSVFTPSAAKQIRPMGSMLEHPDLYAAYPDIGEIKTQAWSASNSGHHRPMTTPTTPATERIRVPTHDFIWPDSARSVALHENQHAVQSREGFAEGGNPADFALNKTDPDAAYLLYKHLAGEVESRNVQTRRNMTPEQRKAAPPWTTEDIPAAQQIVR